jgi:hypothetical protein
VLSVDDETAKAALGPPFGLITWLAMPGIGDFFYHEGRNSSRAPKRRRRS